MVKDYRPVVVVGEGAASLPFSTKQPKKEPCT